MESSYSATLKMRVRAVQFDHVYDAISCDINILVKEGKQKKI